jgi:cytoskeleton protein RodZ
MTDEQQKAADAGAGQEPDAPLGGERLALARRDKQISVLEIAKELHLDEAKVRALERNEFDILGAAVFAKGHLRKYSQLVGVNVDDVLTDYYRMTRSAELPPVVIGRPKLRREISPGPWIAAIIIIAVGAAAYWWFVARPPLISVPAPAPAQDGSAAAEPSAGNPLASADDDDARLVAATPDEVPRQSRVQPQPEPAQAGNSAQAEPASSGAEPPPEGQLRMSLTFTGDCWTEISDATGRRLFFSMGSAGRSVELAGTAPFTVLLGNVENVSVRVNGEVFPISAANVSNRTARLTIGNP